MRAIFNLKVTYCTDASPCWFGGESHAHLLSATIVSIFSVRPKTDETQSLHKF